MNFRRNFFFIGLLFLFFIICYFFQVNNFTNFILENKKISEDSKKPINKFLSNNKQEQIITVKTDVLSIKIDTRGGDIKQAYLLTYFDKLGSFEPLHLIETSKNFIYQIESGILNRIKQNNFMNYEKPLFNVNNDFYILKKNQNELRVPLTYISYDNIVYIKTFIFKRGNFNFNIDYNIINMSNRLLKLTFFGQLKQSINDTNHSLSYFTFDDKYKQYKFKDIENINLNVYSNLGWIAMCQDYFATIWIPDGLYKNNFYTNFIKNKKQVIIGFKQNFVIFPGKKTNVKAMLWVGPELQDKLITVYPNLDLIIDYGYLFFISKFLLNLLKFINIYINNWGISIIVITCIIRIIMHPLIKIQYISIIKTRLLKPKLDNIYKKFLNNKKFQNQEIINLYKKEKVNPLINFLLTIIQMPIFLGLYNALSKSIELRHTSFIFWIHDLSSYDQYYILPILMGIVMYYNQKLSSNNSINIKFVFLIPIVFTVFFIWLPSGLVLYYISNNIINIIQQKIILYNFKKKLELS